MRLKRIPNLGGLLSIAIIFLAILSFSAVAVKGQSTDQLTLGISPQILDLTANPGESVTNVFRLTNASDTTVSIQTTPKNFIPRGEEGAVDLTEDKTSYSLSEWIKVSPSKVDIAPSKTQDFTVTIDVPTSAEPGSHFGSVVFQTIPPEQEGSAALVSQEIAPVILVRIAGDTTESVEIVEFKSQSSFYSNQSAVTLFSRLKNTGNVHFKPKGNIVIKDMFGSEVTAIDLEQRNVLPDTIRQLTSEWSLDGFKIGRYTATLTIVFGEDNQIITEETSFYIFPYQTVVPILLGVALVILILYRGRRRIVKAFYALRGKDETEK